MKTEKTDQAVAVGNSDDHEYHAFLQRVNARFQSNTLNGKRPVFTTDADAPGGVLWAAYLGGFPAADRQHHNCSACRHFVNRYAGLVTIAADGSTKSAVWNPEDAPAEYRDIVSDFARLAELARVTGVFKSALPVWGYEVTGPWRHLFIKPPVAMLHARRDISAGQWRAEKREDFRMLQTALNDYPVAVVEQAVALLKSETLYRSEKVLGAAEWFLSLKRAIDGAQNQYRREAGTWLSVATAPAGFTHVRSSMIGTLLDDIKAGKPMADVKRSFDTKMNPAQYQRAQVAPSAGAIRAAENLVEKLGIAASLPRRYARLAELQTLWMPHGVANPVQDHPGAVFAHITPKTAAPAVGDLEMPGTVTMTWEKFRRTLLSEAVGIEARMPASVDRFAALVTAQDPTAPPILQWDSDAERNPVSWYYASGIDAEIKRRVLEAGGQHTDVDIRGSLLWNNRNDLDLHCITPVGEHIYFCAKRAGCGGWLDVDRNVSGETTTPIENIRWQRGSAREGRYQFYVNNYRFHEYRRDPTPFRFELEVNGEILVFDGVMPAMAGSSENIQVAQFYYHRDSHELVHKVTGLRKSSTAPTSWGVAPGELRKVTAVVESPNLWGEHPMPHHGRHVFFTLDGCQDSEAGRGRGFFTETLKSELRPARSTIEAYTAAAVIADADKADACGLGMSDQADWNLVLRVKTAAGTHHVKVDRFD